MPPVELPVDFGSESEAQGRAACVGLERDFRTERAERLRGVFRARDLLAASSDVEIVTENGDIVAIVVPVGLQADQVSVLQAMIGFHCESSSVLAKRWRVALVLVSPSCKERMIRTDVARPKGWRMRFVG